MVGPEILTAQFLALNRTLVFLFGGGKLYLPLMLITFLVTQTAPLKIDPVTVLLAEDDLDDQELIRDAFYELNPSIELHSFTTGKAFLSKLDSMNRTPDLVILDYNIPEMNGAEILQRIKGSSSYENMVKIVWSTSNSPLYKSSCMALGASAYFVKPSTLSGLSQMAREMLEYVK
jgi:CheY-like chemotaxis protein